MQPDGFVAAAHVHPAQTERFEVLAGTVAFRVGRKTVLAGPGDTLVVPPGTPHRFWNAGSGEARVLCEIRPALRFESLIETMFTLAADGKTNGRGLPGLLQLAVIARTHFDTVRLPFPSARLQRAALAVGAPLGGMLGYEPTIPRRAEQRAEKARGCARGRPHSRPKRLRRR